MILGRVSVAPGAPTVRVSSVYRKAGSALKVKVAITWVCLVFRTPGSACKGTVDRPRDSWGNRQLGTVCGAQALIAPVFLGVDSTTASMASPAASPIVRGCTADPR